MDLNVSEIKQIANYLQIESDILALDESSENEAQPYQIDDQAILGTALKAMTRDEALFDPRELATGAQVTRDLMVRLGEELKQAIPEAAI